jgi:hypothetical protein
VLFHFPSPAFPPAVIFALFRSPLIGGSVQIRQMVRVMECPENVGISRG